MSLLIKILIYDNINNKMEGLLYKCVSKFLPLEKQMKPEDMLFHENCNMSNKLEYSSAVNSCTYTHKKLRQFK